MIGKGCRLVIQSSQHPFQVAHAFAQVFLSLDMQEKPYCTNGAHHTDRHIHIREYIHELKEMDCGVQQNIRTIAKQEKNPRLKYESTVPSWTNHN